VIGPEIANVFVAQATASGAGWNVPPTLFDATAFGVTNPADAEWVNRRMTTHPLRTLSDPVHLTGGLELVQRQTYVRCELFPAEFGDRIVRRFDDSPWDAQRWNSVHDVMITEPHRVYELIRE
jgi:hypothetical protein